MWFRIIFAGIMLAFVAGCGTVQGVKAPQGSAQSVVSSTKVQGSTKQKQYAMVPGNTAHKACTVRGEAGCFEVKVFNFAYDPNHNLMQGLAERPASPQERYERMRTLPTKLVKSYEKGEVQASKPRTFLIYLWGVNPAVTENLSAYKVGKGSVERVPVEDMTMTAPYPNFDPVKDLGPPTRVYRVSAHVMGSIQIPWSMIGDETYLLTCSEDRLSVYPNRVTRQEGLWVYPDQFAFMRKQRWVGTTHTFLSLQK